MLAERSAELGDLPHGGPERAGQLAPGNRQSVVEQAMRVLEAEARTFKFRRAAGGLSLDEIDDRLGGADLARRPPSD